MSSEQPTVCNSTTRAECTARMQHIEDQQKAQALKSDEILKTVRSLDRAIRGDGNGNVGLSTKVHTLTEWKEGFTWKFFVVSLVALGTPLGIITGIIIKHVAS